MNDHSEFFVSSMPNDLFYMVPKYQILKCYNLDNNFKSDKLKIICITLDVFLGLAIGFSL